MPITGVGQEQGHVTTHRPGQPLARSGQDVPQARATAGPSPTAMLLPTAVQARATAGQEIRLFPAL